MLHHQTSFLSKTTWELSETSNIPLPTPREDSHGLPTGPLPHGQGAAPLPLFTAGKQASR